ncbi:MAG TPA: TetR/AcrR family transcriptional regulator [Baekduia sp.]|nr:TetR/AcrR family transcriptional regulator [Baekduia sp.]
MTDQATSETGVAAERRRQILDAAVRVFARQGFHGSRVSDIADEAGVAYGLLYHYFRSKDQLLSTVFSERWKLMLEAIEAADQRDASGREKLDDIAGFIVGSYHHDPDLMKVIIVEVTRAANSFGRTHLDEIRQAFDGIAAIVAAAQAKGEFRADADPQFAAMSFYGVVEQALTAWIFGQLGDTEDEIARVREQIVAMVCDGLRTRA